MNTLTNILGSIEQTYASRIIPWGPRIIQKKSICSTTKWAEWHMWIWFRPMVLSPSFLIFNQECRKVPCTFPRLHGCRMLEQWTCLSVFVSPLTGKYQNSFAAWLQLLLSSWNIPNQYIAHVLETKKTCSFQIPTKKHLPNHQKCHSTIQPPLAPALHSPNPLHCARVDAPNPAPLRWNGPAGGKRREESIR